LTGFKKMTSLCAKVQTPPCHTGRWNQNLWQQNKLR